MSAAKTARKTKRPTRKSVARPRADQARTLEQFQDAFTVRTRASYLSAAERGAQESAPSPPERAPVVGVPPGALMATRWCTMLDALHTIGEALYESRWLPSILEDKPHFPYPKPHLGFVFRRAAVEENGEPGEDLFSPPVDADNERTPWNFGPRDPSWDAALGAYAVLCEALAEGLVLAVAERLASTTVPGRDGGPGPVQVKARDRVAIDAAEWRRDGVILAEGLLRAWWSIARGDIPPEPRWVILVDRESVVEFVERYAPSLTPTMADAAARRRGRVQSVSIAELRNEVLPRWHRREFGEKYAAVHKFIVDRWGVALNTARRYSKQLGICRDGENETPDMNATK